MSSTPKVMIVGAGLAGLFLALLLEKIDVEYEIFERSATLKPYGSGMCLSPNILPAFEQLGLLDDLLKILYRGVTMEVYSDELKKIGQIGPAEDNKIGYDGAFFSRADLHRLLLSKVPAEKIHYGKRVLTVGQSEHGAMIRCADGSVHEGDILIGADGAYSSIRQGLYERLEKDGKLPKNDTESMNIGYSCLVGTTQPLDPEKYPIVKDNFTHFAVVIADEKPHSWTLISVPGNRICWGVTNQPNSEGNKAAFRNSEWRPESVDAAITPLLDHKVSFGGLLVESGHKNPLHVTLLGDLIGATPKELISNVYLEEKLFKTWTHRRIALIGDACHKMLPRAGQGKR
ncbi:hypothetical protein BGX26_012539 [Mortierella sp. AD094]|nr:hypothetical protein BGX26_012539 [Mortierella sp. AD094]